MFNLFAEMITYPFIMRALIVGTLVSLCAALLGVSLVLKRYSMIGDCLSHVAFGAMAIALVLGTAPLTVGIPIVVLSAFMILRLSENGKMKGDAVIALISSSALAIGVMSISIKSGMNTDICNYMFGSILAMSHSDVHLSIILSIIVLIKAVASELYGKTVLIASGGIDSAEEAYSRIKSGANLVQIYTSFIFKGPSIAKRINEGILKLLKEDNFASIGEAVGCEIKNKI